jgi:hypothetical protein
MIHVLNGKATSEQLQDMLGEHSTMIKIAVDVRQRGLAGGGNMPADCEALWLAEGSAQDDIWGANWYPADQSIEFEPLINIRPAQGNRSIVLQDEALRRAVEAITLELLGGVQ